MMKNSIIALTSLLALFACVDEAPSANIEKAREPESRNEMSLGDVEISRPETTHEKRGIMFPIKVRERKGVKASMAGGPPLPIYMNFNGGTYSGGFDNSANNVSSVVGQGQAFVGAFSGSAQQRQQIMDCVIDQFSRFNTIVTEVEPTSGDYIESVVGGHPSQVGMPGNIGGVAPIDNFQCNVISRAVVYTFTDNIGNNPQRVCEIVAQEVAHALSLDHEYLCEDPMSYLNGCGAKEFRDIDAQCGEYSVRACNCNRSSHNSVQILLDKLGPSDGTPPIPPPDDNEDPTVEIVSPANNATLQANTTIQVVAQADDDAGVTSMELVWDFGGGSAFDCPSQGNGYSCTRTGDTSTWTLQVGTGSRTFRVRVRDVAGNSVESDTFTIGLGEEVSSDDQAPAVRIISPNDGEEFLADESIEIVASVTDDTGVDNVELLWEFSGTAFSCPTNNNNVRCVVSGSNYTWTLEGGEGPRGFKVRARDAAGNESESERRVVTFPVTPGDPDETNDPIDPPVEPTPVNDDPFEDNDEFAQATALACASAIDAKIVVGDDDWYSLAIAPDVVVSVATTSPSETPIFLAMADQPDRILLESNDMRSAKQLSLSSKGDNLRVRVRSSENGDYRLVVTCDGQLEDAVHQVSSCSNSRSTMPLFGFVGLSMVALLRRRRRR